MGRMQIKETATRKRNIKGNTSSKELDIWKILNKNTYLGDIYIEMIVNAVRVDEIVEGGHVNWKWRRTYSRAD